MHRARLTLLAGVVTALAGCVGDIGGDQRPAGERPAVAPDPSSPAGERPAVGSGPSSPRQTTGAGPCDALRPRRLVKLSDRQYARVLRDLFSLTELPVAVQTPGASAESFLEDLESHRIGDGLASQFQRSAQAVAALVAREPARAGFTCAGQPSRPDACVRGWIERFVARAFRRPLLPVEVDDHARVFEVGAADGTASGVALVVEAVLQAPSFLYRTELGSETKDGRSALDPYEIASQLSFWLVESLPDAELTAAAADGRLRDPEVVRQQATRLLASQRARDTVNAAFVRWFGMADLHEVEKADGVWKGFPSIRNDLAASFGLTVGDVLWSKGSFGRLFTSNEFFVSAAIAPLFGVPAPSGAGMSRVTAPGGQRAGILTHPGLMARHASQTTSDVIKRGVLVRRELLCQPLQPPPDALAEEIAAFPHDLSPRQLAAERAKRASCSGCHALIDPFGLLFERYDAVGRYREAVGGAPIDTKVTIGGTDFDGQVDGAIELGARLAGSAMQRACVAAKMVSLALEREIEASECTVRRLSDAFAQNGQSVGALLVDIAASDEFRFRK